MEAIHGYPCPKCGYSPQHNTLPYTLKPGMVLKGKYMIGKVLGQGGFGITYIGMDLVLQRKVAIKEYYPSGLVSRKYGTSNLVWYSGELAQQARRFGSEVVLKEAQKMSKADHISSVVKVFDVFPENETAYICMDFIEGQTLQHKLKANGPLSWEAAKALFLPVIHSMEQVHQVGLIHRDLSPDNLMFQSDGNVKILDLGAAKDLNLNSGTSSMRVAKNGFSPLEQYMQTGASGSWTDVYALAATIYYALTGVVPPSALDRANIDQLLWNLPVLQVLPQNVIRALQHAMAVLPKERTQTMSDFLRELKEEGRKPTPNPLWKWAVAGVAALAVLTGIVIGLIPDRNDSKPAAASSPKPSITAAAPSVRQLQDRISDLTAGCTMETYHYRNGSRMEMYFDDQDNECLRFFVNENGEKEFTILAEYDSEGNILEKYGFKDQQLVRYNIWHRNEAGKITEILEFKDNHILLEKTEYKYDSQGREISRTGTDKDGQTTFYGNSTYDAANRQTRTGVNEEGNNYVYVYSADGNLTELTVTKPNGDHVTRSSYKYDKDGKGLEDIGYDKDGKVSYRKTYLYEGDLEVGYVWNSFYSDILNTSEHRYIFGPRNVLMGIRNLEKDYGSEYEYVEDMSGSWILRQFHYNENAYLADYQIYLYDWGTSLGYEGFDENGNLVAKSTELFDESGKNTGTETINYETDGSYTVSLYDEDYHWLSYKTYNSDNSLVEETQYQYDASGTRSGHVTTKYHEDGSYTRTETDASYHDLTSNTYDSFGNLINEIEYSYNSDGTRKGSTSTVYYNDGSYTVTIIEGYTTIVSRKTYDSNGKRIS